MEIWKKTPPPAMSAWFMNAPFKKIKILKLEFKGYSKNYLPFLFQEYLSISDALVMYFNLRLRYMN